MTTLQRRIYGAVIRLHPASFRNEFGREMALDFEDAVRDCGFTPLLGDAMLSLARQWKVRALEGPEPDPIPQRATGHPFLAGQYLAVDQGTPVTAYDLARAALVSLLLLLTIGLAASVPNRRAIADVQSVRVSHDGGIDTGHNGPPLATNPARREWPGGDPYLTVPGAGVGPFRGRIYLGPGRGAAPPGFGPRVSGGPRARPVTLVHALVQLTVISIIVWLTSMFLLRSSGVGRRAALAALGLLAIAASVAFGQAHSVEAGKAAAVQPVEHDYRFEVASIRLTDPPGLNKGGSLQPYSPGRYREERIYPAALVMKAFNLKHAYQIEYPSWMSSTYFAVNATLPEGATKADLPIMIRHLLEDRFALKYHYETRRISGYELVVAKSGPRLAKSAEPAPDPSASKGLMIEVKNGVPQFSRDAGSGQLYAGTTAWWRGRNKTMQSLASDLSDRLYVPVTDATGLTDEYDYTLTYTPGEEMYGPRYVPPADGEMASAPLEHPLLRDALREQLGLELRPVKNVSIDVVVVDSANKEPTEN